MPASPEESIKIFKERLKIKEITLNIQEKMPFVVKEFKEKLELRINTLFQNELPKSPTKLKELIRLIEIRRFAEKYLHESNPYLEKYITQNLNNIKEIDIDSFTQYMLEIHDSSFDREIAIQEADKILDQINNSGTTFVVSAEHDFVVAKNPNNPVPASLYSANYQDEVGYLKNNIDTQKPLRVLYLANSGCGKHAVEQVHSRNRLGQQTNTGLIVVETGEQFVSNFLNMAKEESYNWGDSKAHINLDGSNNHIIGQLGSAVYCHTNNLQIPYNC